MALYSTSIEVSLKAHHHTYFESPFLLPNGPLLDVHGMFSLKVLYSTSKEGSLSRPPTRRSRTALAQGPRLDVHKRPSQAHYLHVHGRLSLKALYSRDFQGWHSLMTLRSTTRPWKVLFPGPLLDVPGRSSVMTSNRGPLKGPPFRPSSRRLLKVLCHNL